jgi:hypothetical protein
MEVGSRIDPLRYRHMGEALCLRKHTDTGVSVDLAAADVKDETGIV